MYRKLTVENQRKENRIWILTKDNDRLRQKVDKLETILQQLCNNMNQISQKLKITEEGFDALDEISSEQITSWSQKVMFRELYIEELEQRVAHLERTIKDVRPPFRSRSCR